MRVIAILESEEWDMARAAEEAGVGVEQDFDTFGFETGSEAAKRFPGIHFAGGDATGRMICILRKPCVLLESPDVSMWLANDPSPGRVETARYEVNVVNPGPPRWQWIALLAITIALSLFLLDWWQSGR